MTHVADPKSKVLIGERAGPLLCGAVIACVVGTLSLAALALIKVTFSHEHAWASAHFATIARNFAEHGIVALRGLPIENNDPLTSEPDTYLHWPPLFFYVLGEWIAIFGDSVRGIQLFMMLIAIATATTLGLLVRQFGSVTQAVFCAAAFILMPATFRFGLMPLPISMALLLTGLALLLVAGAVRSQERPSGAGLHGRLLLSAIVFALAIATSWEAVLAVPGIFLAWLIRRDRRILRLLVWWSAACGLSLALVGMLYALSDESFGQELWRVFQLRAGLADYAALPSRIHLLETEVDSKVTARMLALLALRIPDFIQGIAILGLCTLPFVIVGRGMRPIGSFGSVVVLSFASMWIAWAVLMKEHFFMHDYQMLLASPVSAIGISVLMVLIADESAPSTARGLHFRHLFAGIGLPIALISGAVLPFAGFLRWQDPLVEFGREVRHGVPEGALVLTDQLSMLPVWYSRRHILRGIEDERQLRQRIPDIRRLCESCAVYLAVPPSSAAKFNGLIAASSSAVHGQNAVIVPLR